MDGYPVSRAVMDYGNPRFTVGDEYGYTFPVWMGDVSKAGGDWVTNNPTAWHVPATVPTNVSLFLDIAPQLITNATSNVAIRSLTLE
ncbi:MAG: hypothetical protein AAF492_21000, partial [Verrucomicrobiota bacterium]